jgi:hypothetical protein
MTSTRHLTVYELSEGMEVLERRTAANRPPLWLTVRSLGQRPDGRLMVQLSDGSVLDAEPTAIVLARDPQQVYPLASGAGWMVRSASLPGAYRHVSYDRGHFACTCPGARNMVETRRPCRHVKAVAEWEAATAPPARPSAVPAVSALCD